MLTVSLIRATIGVTDDVYYATAASKFDNTKNKNNLRKSRLNFQKKSQLFLKLGYT
jgi:hypothetical protein